MITIAAMAGSIAPWFFTRTRPRLTAIHWRSIAWIYCLYHSSLAIVVRARSDFFSCGTIYGLGKSRHFWRHRGAFHFSCTRLDP